MLNPQTSPEEFRAAVLPFLQRHGLVGDVELSVLRGGANNRVYLARDSQRSAVLKFYFQHPDDDRDRFRVERTFYEFLWRHEVRQVPEPLGWDAESRTGLFGLVTGRKLSTGEVNHEMVSQAAQFVLELNRHRHGPAAREVPLASEACFTVEEHLDCIERRVLRLQHVEGTSDIDRQASLFAANELTPTWRRLSDSARRRISESGLQSGRSSESRVLSPSDFGFHNALLTTGGQLRFFDFEYAGWDDPAKLICDFFCQPEVPVPLGHWNQFAASVGSVAADDSLPARARLLLPAYQVKWCCIMLNDFIRADRARRNFAGSGSEERKAGQLEKARRLLGRVGEE